MRSGQYTFSPVRRDPAPVGWLLLATVLAAVVFSAFPELDLWAASLFWDPEAGFWMGESLYAQAWYHGITRVRNVVVIPACVILLVWWGVRRRLPLGIPARAFLLFLGTLTIGSGLIVNEALKNRWDRARPREIERFGGTAEFTPALVPADQCDDNCSFVSGHASFVFLGYAIALLLRRRKAAIAGVTVLGAMAGLGRMMQGGHFLSDVVFAGIVMFLVAWALHRALFRGGAGPPEPESDVAEARAA
ncbi:MAG: phosphatase PAP2 family protein [Gemmatimonadota bacterium]|nr:phosphatase PAP2 family protein [Gemmatimonadota bacterium]